jgi:hypothetical protein
MPLPPVAELESRLVTLGWRLDKLDTPNPSTGRYVVKATGPGGQKISRDGQSPEMALSALVAFAQRANAIRSFSNLTQMLKTAGAWQLPIEHRLDEIGQKYAELPIYDKKSLPAWQALADESKRQADAIRNQIMVNETDDPEPYPHHAAMIHDLHHKGNLTVTRGQPFSHPVWTPEQQTDFRIVHNTMGHGAAGTGYDWPGEIAAASHHLPLVSPIARPALAAETLGKSAYALSRGSHGYGMQKAATMDDLAKELEKRNGNMPWVPHGENWRVPERPVPVPVVAAPVPGEWSEY